MSRLMGEALRQRPRREQPVGETALADFQTCCFAQALLPSVPCRLSASRAHVSTSPCDAVGTEMLLPCACHHKNASSVVAVSTETIKPILPTAATGSGQYQRPHGLTTGCRTCPSHHNKVSSFISSLVRMPMVKDGTISKEWSASLVAALRLNLESA